jgi:hypothetical protein
MYEILEKKKPFKDQTFAAWCFFAAALSVIQSHNRPTESGDMPISILLVRRTQTGGSK